MAVKGPILPVTSTHLHSLGIGSRKYWRKASLESRGYTEGEQEEPQATVLKSHLSAIKVIMLTHLRQTKLRYSEIQIYRNQYTENKSTSPKAEIPLYL